MSGFRGAGTYSIVLRKDIKAKGGAIFVPVQGRRRLFTESNLKTLRERSPLRSGSPSDREDEKKKGEEFEVVTYRERREGGRRGRRYIAQEDCRTLGTKRKRREINMLLSLRPKSAEVGGVCRGTLFT